MEKSIKAVIQSKVNYVYMINAILFFSLAVINIYVRNVKVVHIATNGSTQKIETVKKYSEYFSALSLFTILILSLMVVISLVYVKKAIDNVLNEFNHLTSKIIADEEVLNIADIEYIEFREVATKWNDKLIRIAGYHKKRELYFNTIIHDLKFPLQGLKSNCSIYEKKWGPNRQIQKIKDTTISLEQDINRFLILDKIEYFDIPQIETRDLLKDLRTMINNLGDVQIKINLINGENLDGLYKSYDYSFINKIVGNLIENAYKYASDKELNIIVNSECLIFSNKCHRHHENIFGKERFRSASGTGLGSQIVKKYVDILNWDIYSKSKEEVFWVILKFEREGIGEKKVFNNDLHSFNN